MQQHIIENAAQVTKVSAGGAGVAGGSYVVSEQTMQAISGMNVAEIQAYATLIATGFTILYFFAVFVLTCIKIYKESHGKTTN